MAGNRLRELATLVREADGFVAIAKLVCAHSRELFSAGRCSICLHAASGRPRIMVDNSADEIDRVAYLEREWMDDALLHSMLQRFALTCDSHAVLVPVVVPAGVIASIRCSELGPQAQDRESHLSTVAMLVATRLAELGIAPEPDGTAGCLTVRQQEIAELASRGLRTAEIAEHLAISPNTVKKLLKQIFERLEVSNRVELVHVLPRCRVANLDAPIGISRQGQLAIARVA